MSRWLPYPLLSAALLLMWLLLNQFSVGHLLLGTIIAITCSWAMSALQPEKPRIRNWWLVVRLLGTIFVDITRSNIAVTRIVLGRKGNRRSGFVVIPLDLRDRTGLAILSCVVTSTPGTAWVNFDARHGTLLIHVLDLDGEADWKDYIKQHYEKPLMEIFE